MSEDLVIGYDGKARSAWAGAADTAFARYHDAVWGARTSDEPALFEALKLGVFEAGLSWSVVFGKRGRLPQRLPRLRRRARRGDDGARR